MSTATEATDTSGQAADVDSLLAALPGSFLIGSSAGARLVASPTGAFVVVAAGPEPLADADRAGQLASATRRSLAEQLAWIPFVDAVVVTAGARIDSGAATGVPLDLLAEVLVEGPEVIDASVLEAIGSMLTDGRLPGWRAGIELDDGTIYGCRPTDITRAS